MQQPQTLALPTQTTALVATMPAPAAAAAQTMLAVTTKSSSKTNNEESKETLSLPTHPSSSTSTSTHTSISMTIQPILSVDTIKSSILTLQQQLVQEHALITQHSQTHSLLQFDYQQLQHSKQSLSNQLQRVLHEKATWLQTQPLELTLYKNKIKNLMCDYNQELHFYRIHTLHDYLTLTHSHFTQQQVLHAEIESLHKILHQQENTFNTFMNDIKKQQEMAIMELREYYELKNQECKNYFFKLMKTQHEASDAAKQTRIQLLENVKNSQIQTSITKHQQTHDAMKKYFNDILHNHLESIKNLKEEVGDMKKKEWTFSMEMNKICKWNEKLYEPLQKNELKIVILNQQMKEDQDNKKILQILQQQLMQLNNEYDDIQWQIELLIQQKNTVSRDNIQQNKVWQKWHYGQQQQSLFTANIYSHKIYILQQEIEKAEAGLSELLLASHLNPKIVNHLSYNLEEILMMKNKMIMQLEDEVKEWQKRIQYRKQLYYEEMEKYGIPREELGFEPVKEM